MLKKIQNFLLKNDLQQVNNNISKLNKDLIKYKREYSKLNKIFNKNKEIIDNNNYDNFYRKLESKKENYIDLINHIEDTIKLYKQLSIAYLPRTIKKIKDKIDINESYINEVIYIINKFY